MQTCLRLVVLSGLLLGTTARAADDPPGGKAIQDAIKSLQAKKASATDPTDRDKIDQAVAALQKLIAKPAAVRHVFPQLTPEMLKEKLHGRASYDAKTGELTLTYDFANQEQMKDFDLGRGSRLKMSSGVLTLNGSEKYTHIVLFRTMRANVDVTVPFKPLGFYLGTTNDLQVYLHEDWSIEMWLDGHMAAKKPLPLGQRGKLLRFGMAVEENRIAVQAGGVVLGGNITDKPRGGQVILYGGHNDGAQFRNLVIKGEPDPDWIKSFFAQ